MENHVARSHVTSRYRLAWAASVIMAIGLVPWTAPGVSLNSGEFASAGLAVPPDVAGDATLPPQGSLLWSFPVEERGQTDVAVVTDSAVVAFDRLLVPLAGPPPRGVVALDLQPQAGAVPSERWFHPTDLGVYRAPGTWKDLVYFITGIPGDVNRGLHCIRLEDGLAPEAYRTEWPRPVHPRASGVFMVAHGHVFVQDYPARLACLGAAGREQFVVDIGVLEYPVAVTATMVLVASAEPAVLWVLDRPTGKTLWRELLPGRPVAAPHCVDDVIYAATDGGVHAFDLISGSALDDWRGGSDTPAGPLTVLSDCLLYVSNAAVLVIVDRNNGHVIRRITGPVLTRSVLPTADHVLYATVQGWFTLDRPSIRACKPILWSTLPVGARPVGPGVVTGSRMYVPLAGWGLTCWGAAP